MRSPKIQASELERQILIKISRQTTSSVREVDRSRLILMMLEGHSNMKIQSEAACCWGKVQKWRYRWLSFEPGFQEIENRDKKVLLEHDLEEKIRECLSDAPRPGKPLRITAEEYCQILGVSLEDPQLSDRPISQWTLDELVDEVKKRGIQISRSHLGSFLKRKRGETPQDARLAES